MSRRAKSYVVTFVRSVTVETPETELTTTCSDGSQGLSIPIPASSRTYAAGERVKLGSKRAAQAFAKHYGDAVSPEIEVTS